jgi:hypothetical protein
LITRLLYCIFVETKNIYNMEVKEQVRLQMIEMHIDLKIELYEQSINRLEGESKLYGEKEFPELIAINNKWIEKYKGFIELLNDLKK